MFLDVLGRIIVEAFLLEGGHTNDDFFMLIFAF
jgi:hypothetical protein